MAMNEDDARTLYDQLAEAWSSANPGTAHRLAVEAWAAMSSRDPNKYDAESARLASIDAARIDSSQTMLWRMRALARYAAIGWHEGVGAIILSESFSVLSRENDDYPRGRRIDVVRGSTMALEILDEVGTLATRPSSGISVGPRSPSPQLLTRFFYERRALHLLLLRRLSEASEAYRLATEHAESERGRLRARAGAALVRYLEGDREDARRATASVLLDATDSGDEDVAASAVANLAVMDADRDDLATYDIL